MCGAVHTQGTCNGTLASKCTVFEMPSAQKLLSKGTTHTENLMQCFCSVCDTLVKDCKHWGDGALPTLPASSDVRLLHTVAVYRLSTLIGDRRSSL